MEKKYTINFSIIMPTYNRKDIISNAINSILAQDYQEFELIIVDDGSTDGTEQYLKENYAKQLNSFKLRYYKINKSGVCAARNKGLEEAKNDWIAYVDSDNSIVPEFLYVFSNAINKYHNKKCFYARWKTIVTKKESAFVPFDYSKLVQHNYIDLGVYVHHKSVYQELGGFDITLTRLVDWDLIIRYSQKYKPQPIDKVVLNYNDDRSINRITMSGNYSIAHNVIMQRYANTFTVSTIIISYNQEKYIEQAIQSALMQFGGFIHEILIADDASTDGTREIIKQYVEKYPNIIKDISSNQNLGISRNYERAFKLAKGKYIAILEGDDYWLSTHKLSKQVELLESHPGLKMAFSSVKVLNNASGEFIRQTNANLHKSILTYKDFLNDERQNLIVNFSCCLFKKKEMIKLPTIIFENRISEVALGFYFTKFGRVGYIDEPLSVYRQHGHGVWSGLDNKEKLLSGYNCRMTALKVANGNSKLELYKVLKEKYIPLLLESKLISNGDVARLDKYISGVKIGRLFSLIPRALWGFCSLIVDFCSVTKVYGLKKALKKAGCKLLRPFLNEYLLGKNFPNVNKLQTINDNLLVNDNLIINPNFIINTRNRRLYRKGYTVNRWRLSEGTLEKNIDGSITLSSVVNPNADLTCFFRQYIENAETFHGKRLVMSCRVQEVIGDWYIQFLGSAKRKLESNGIFSVSGTASDKFSDVRVFTYEKNASIKILWIKLEQASHRTAFVNPDLMQEEFRCYQYNYIIRKNIIKRMEYREGDAVYFHFNMPMCLKKYPKFRCDKSCYEVRTVDNKVIYGELDISNVIGRELYISFKTQGMPISDGDLILYIKKDILVDAESY